MGEIVDWLTDVGTIQIIQLHGDGDERTLHPGIKASDHGTVDQGGCMAVDDILRTEQLSCEYLLLDTYTQGAGHGGSGQVTDWNLIPLTDKPFFWQRLQKSAFAKT